MTDEQFDLLVKNTPKETLRRQMRSLSRWWQWQLWRREHPRLAAFLDALCSANPFM